MWKNVTESFSFTSLWRALCASWNEQLVKSQQHASRFRTSCEVRHCLLMQCAMCRGLVRMEARRSALSCKRCYWSRVEAKLKINRIRCFLGKLIFKNNLLDSCWNHRTALRELAAERLEKATIKEQLLQKEEEKNVVDDRREVEGLEARRENQPYWSRLWWSATSMCASLENENSLLLNSRINSSREISKVLWISH